MTKEEMESAYAPYKLEKQGQRLMDKTYHPMHTINDETRIELAKWFITMIKATVVGDMKAKVSLWRDWPLDDPLLDAMRLKKDVGLATTNFPVPDIVEAEILAYARERSVMLTDARVVDMISDKQSYPSETTGAATYWGDNVPAGDPTAEEVELDAEELNSFSTAKEDALMDARSDIVAWLTESMAEAAALELDDAGFNGDGGSAYGSHSGVIVAAGYSVVFASTSTNFSELVLDNISEAISKLDGLRKVGAKFYLHGTGLHWVRMLRDDQGRPIFVDTMNNTNTLAGTGRMFGYPVQEVIKMPTTAANTCMILFGNMRGFLVGRRLASTVLKVDPYGLIMSNRIRYKIYQRWALKTALPNNFCKIMTHS
jgi:HK97 family phage major capsid protein